MASSISDDSAASTASRLRVLTWNVHDLLGDPLAVVRVLRAAAADVVCLQEAPRWPGSRSRLGALARQSGLALAGGGRSSAGTAILTSWRTVTTGVSAFALPVTGWRTRPRGAVSARVSLPGHPGVSVLCVHLGLTGAERADHVRRLSARLREGQGPLLVAGDLNEPPGGPSWTAFATLVGDPCPDAGPTFPVSGPRARIDAVLVSPALRVVEYGTWQADPTDLALASDHRPLLAVIETTAAG